MPRRTPARRGPSRREFIALGLGAFVLSVTPLAWRRRARLFRRSVPLMGTLAEIAVVADDAGEARAAIDAAIEELHRVDTTMSRFRADSDVGRVNLARPGEPVVVTPATALVLHAALRWAEATEGAFDPCVGRAIELWDVGHRRAPPASQRVARLAGRRLYRTLDVATHRGAPVAVLAEADAGIDLGGIAKGYGVDRAVAALRERRISDALVNVGGDLYCLGVSPEGDPWRIGVRDPAAPARITRRIEVRDAAVATSGDYEQYFEHGGRRYHHLLDPATAAPRASADHSLTVVADTCTNADAAATAAFGGAAPAGLVRRVAPDARIVGGA